jgi:gluconolactonase
MAALESLTGPGAPEKIAGGFRSTDGPAFSRLGYLLFSDVPAGRIHKWEAGKVTVFRERTNGAAGLTFDHQGRLLAAERDRVTRTEKNGAIAVLAKVSGGRPADVVYAIDGSIYFTAQSLFQITRAGEPREAARGFGRPTGVALAPNQRMLYAGDAADRKIRVYEIEPDGALRGGRVFAGNAAGGMKTDEQGNLWVADSAGIVVFDAGGKRIGTVELPEPATNCNCGDGFRNLYVTAGTSVYRIPTRVNGTRTY